MALTAGSDILIGDFFPSFTAGEAINARDCVAVGDGTSIDGNSTNTGTGSGTNDSDIATTTNWFSQGFTTSSIEKSIAQGSCSFQQVATGGTSSYDITMSIRADSGGKPTGADLVSGTVNMTIATSSQGDATVTFGTPYAATPSTVYHLVVRAVRTAGVETLYIKRGNSAAQGTNESTNSGSTWVAHNGALQSSVSEITSIAGRIYQANGPTSSQLSNNGSYRTKGIVGMAQAAAASGAAVIVQNAGVMAGFSGLTVGSTYYVGTSGASTATSPGTFAIVLGVAISTTQILLSPAVR